MRKQALSTLTLVVLALACAGEASALVQRTFVSKFGVDTNPCSATEPCRTFTAAIAQTLPGGEVLALDTAGYGPATITKAISLISPPGVYAGITTTTTFTDGITISAGATDVVVLKGLSLSGLGIGASGIRFNSGKQLRVEGLTISGFDDLGIWFSPAATARMSVTDTIVRDNADYAIYAVAPAGQLARVTVNRTTVTGNPLGFVADTNSRMTVRDSVASGNASVGFWVRAVSAVLNVENCLSSDNGTGIYGDGGVVRVAGTTVAENGLGLGSINGGSVLSRGNNTVEGNTTNGAFTGPFFAK